MSRPEEIDILLKFSRLSIRNALLENLTRNRFRFNLAQSIFTTTIIHLLNQRNLLLHGFINHHQVCEDRLHLGNDDQGIGRGSESESTLSGGLNLQILA